MHRTVVLAADLLVLVFIFASVQSTFPGLSNIFGTFRLFHTFFCFSSKSFRFFSTVYSDDSINFHIYA